ICNIVATADTRMPIRIGPMGMDSRGITATTTTDLGRRLSVVARVLPVATVACWAITIVVPVLDSGEPDSLRIRVTSLGYSPIDMNDLDEAYLLLWAVVLIVAVTARSEERRVGKAWRGGWGRRSWEGQGEDQRGGGDSQ